MKNFFKSGRYLFWLSAPAMILGAGVFADGYGKQYSHDDMAVGLSCFVGGVLVWLRASKQEQRFEQTIKIDQSEGA